MIPVRPSMNYEKPGTITLLQNIKMNAVNLNYSFEVGHLATIVDVGLTMLLLISIISRLFA